jgi:hypothetical protein
MRVKSLFLMRYWHWRLAPLVLRPLPLLMLVMLIQVPLVGYMGIESGLIEEMATCTRVVNFK